MRPFSSVWLGGAISRRFCEYHVIAPTTVFCSVFDSAPSAYRSPPDLWVNRRPFPTFRPVDRDLFVTLALMVEISGVVRRQGHRATFAKTKYCLVDRRLLLRLLETVVATCRPVYDHLSDGCIFVWSVKITSPTTNVYRLEP